MKMPEENTAVMTTPAGVAMEVELDKPTDLQASQPTEAAKTFLNEVPEGFRDKPWVSKFVTTDNPREEFFKSVDNLQAMAGKKAEGLKIPAADAPPEAWQEVYKALGVPEKPEGYEYTAPKAPEGLESYLQTDEKLLNGLRERAHKSGMTPQAWKSVVDGYNEYVVQSAQQQVQQVEAMLKQTQEAFVAKYGERAPQVLDTFEKAVGGLPEGNNKTILNALQPATKAALADIFQNFSSKYISEDKLDLSGISSVAKSMNRTEYGDAYEQAYSKMRQAEKQHGKSSGDYIKAKAALANLRVEAEKQGIFKDG